MARKWWTLIAVSVATFMLLLDITVVNTALPAIEEDLGATLHRPPVGGRRLHADARRVRPHGGLAGRPARPPARVRRGARDLHARLAARRAGDRPDLPEPGAGGPGHRRRDHVRRLAGAARPGVRGRQGARQRPRRLRRHDRRGRGHRAAGRRRDRRRTRLGVGLLPERAGRHGRRRGHLPEAARVARPERHAASTGPAWRPSARRCSCSCSRSCAATRRAGAAR